MLANRVNTDRKNDHKDVRSREGQAAGARVTVIDPQAKVLADSEAPSSTTEDQARTPEFDAALRGEIGSDVRQSRTVGVPLLYVAAPVEGGAVRLAYPLSDVQAALGRARHTLLLGSLLALAVALLISGAVAAFTARRLERIMQVAKRIARGDLGGRISENLGGEIGQLAASLDKTARTLEERFAALKNSQAQLETLLNSMQDAVITVGGDDRVQWANRAMNRLVPQRTRLDAPVVETVRDPDFLRAVRAACAGRAPTTARATSILPGRTFDVTAGLLPGVGAVAVLRDLTDTERVDETQRHFVVNVTRQLWYAPPF